MGTGEGGEKNGPTSPTGSPMLGTSERVPVVSDSCAFISHKTLQYPRVNIRTCSNYTHSVVPGDERKSITSKQRIDDYREPLIDVVNVEGGDSHQACFPAAAGFAATNLRRHTASRCTKALQNLVVGQFPVTRQTRHKATFATPLSENMNEDSTVELHVGLLGEGTGCSRPTKASNIGDGRSQLNAPNLYVAMTRGSELLV
jgi:hypothetical protein